MKERRFEPMEMEERDVVTFTDEEGNEFELDVIEYFEYEGQEYAVLMDLGEDDADEGEDTAEVYIMKIVVDGDTEEFLPADEDKMRLLKSLRSCSPKSANVKASVNAKAAAAAIATSKLSGTCKEGLSPLCCFGAGMIK